MEYPTSHLYFLGIHTSLNFIENKIAAEHDGKVELNTVEYTTAFLYSDWLYFLWHGINGGMSIASFEMNVDKLIFQFQSKPPGFKLPWGKGSSDSR